MADDIEDLRKRVEDLERIVSSLEKYAIAADRAVGATLAATVQKVMNPASRVSLRPAFTAPEGLEPTHQAALQRIFT